MSRFILVFLIALPAWAARSFNGTNQYIVATSAVVSVPFTVSVWFRASSLDATGCLFSLGNSGNDSAHYLFFRGATAGDPITITSNQAGVGNSEASTGTSGVATGTWYHVSATVSAGNARSIRWQGATYTDSGNFVPAGLNRTAIGRLERATPGQHFAGDIAEVGVWSAALTEAEQDSLARGCSPLLVRPSALVFYAPLWRTVADYRQPVSLTDNGTTAASTHPRIYR